MQDQNTPNLGRVLNDAQQCVMCALLAPVGSGICSLGELALAVGDPTTAELAVAGLHADGLVHRLDGFVFHSRRCTGAGTGHARSTTHLLKGS